MKKQRHWILQTLFIYLTLQLSTFKKETMTSALSSVNEGDSMENSIGVITLFCLN